MSPKNRRSRNDHRDTNGGNVLFTLGLVSVIALLIVGWVMTQGGIPTLAEKMPNLKNISITTEPKPTEIPKPITVTSTGSEDQINRLIAEYETKLKNLNETWEKRVDDLKKDYERQLSNLKIQVISLTDENKRLRERR